MGRYITATPAANPEAVKSIQTGYVSTTSISTGSGEAMSYIDVTISSINTGKSIVTVIGGTVTASINEFLKSGASNTYQLSGQFTSSTNLRLGAPISFGISAKCRWTVVEYY